MILLNKEQIKYLHNKMIRETGGSNGIRDEGFLDSALSAPFQSFGGMELYPSMIGRQPDCVRFRDIVSGEIEEKDIGIWIVTHNRGE